MPKKVKSQQCLICFRLVSPTTKLLVHTKVFTSFCDLCIPFPFALLNCETTPYPNMAMAITTWQLDSHKTPSEMLFTFAIVVNV